MNLMYKVIVAGGRDFNDYAMVEEKLNYLLSQKSDIEIVCGMARGADLLGFRYAKKNNLSIKQFPAKWAKDGLQAGYLRNLEMARYADACVCFWDGKSKGTADMIRCARKHKLQLRVFKY